MRGTGDHNRARRIMQMSAADGRLRRFPECMPGRIRPGGASSRVSPKAGDRNGTCSNFICKSPIPSLLCMDISGHARCAPWKDIDRRFDMIHRSIMRTKLIMVAAGVIMGCFIVYLSLGLSGIAANTYTASELASVRLTALAALGTFIVFVVGLQLFALKAVGDTTRLGLAGVNAHQIRIQLCFIWLLIAINITCINLLVLFGAFAPEFLIFQKIFGAEFHNLWILAKLQSILFGLIYASASSSLLCALTDIAMVYIEKFFVGNNNGAG